MADASASASASPAPARTAEGSAGQDGPYTAPAPKRLDDGTLVFEDAARFRPNLTPEEVLRKGSFGGGYFRPIVSEVTGKRYEGHWKELPAEWIEGLDVARMVASPKYREGVNNFGVKCGQSLEAWHEKGWIVAQDPAGWFHWYCRFYRGRRTDDDERQISRWYGIAGPKGRWKTHLCKAVLKHGVAFDDPVASPVVRQTLQHWAYQLSEADFKSTCKRIGM